MLEAYIEGLKSELEAAAQPETAMQMSAYMKNKFEFYGLKKPFRQAVTKPYTAKNGFPDLEDIPTFLEMLWDEPYRELHYFGLEVLDKHLKKMPEDTVDLIEYLILTQSWWDTVDWLATRSMGSLMKRFPNLIEGMNDKFVNSSNFWLNRTSIIFQLKYKTDTNEGLLVSNILKHNHQKEFFIRKAIGWALREYSKTDGNFVKDFVANHELSSLSKREALKWMQKKGI
ncbi:MAG: DNA alkylation repair protein [Saprospiraceae bacterium]